MANNTDTIEKVEQGENIVTSPQSQALSKEVDNGGIDGSQIEESTSKDLSGDKEDYFLTRMKQPALSTDNLMELYGAGGFNDFKSKEEYWKDEDIQKAYSTRYGSDAEYKFEQDYNNSKKEYSQFQLGNYEKSVSGYELVRDDLSSLRADATMRFTNMAGTVMQGLDWSNPTKDYRENFSEIKIRKTDADGSHSYETIDYSPEALKALEESDPSFGGLAYSDAFYNLDPNEGVNGLYFNAIYDGKVLDEATGSEVDVRNDQVVSKWDIETGSILDGVLKNNKLEADSVLDYAKILVKAPINMAVNMLDTSIQLSRAAIAGAYGITSKLSNDDLTVESSEAYKWLTTKGIQAKQYNTSMTREAIQDGFFGSLEAALSTTADVALQVAMAGALGKAGRSIPSIVNKGLTGKALAQAEKRAAEIAVRGTLTALAVKDSYNEALENGYTTTEASMITGAMGIAMWKATKYASYIFGDYEAKAVRESIKKAITNEQQTGIKTAFDKITNKATAAGTAASKKTMEQKALAAYKGAHKAVSNVFGKFTKQLPPKQWMYAARQEGLEEMTEELFQDGVKQVASAYGYLMNNAIEAGKGRYMSIFDPGYFEDAVERYATSGVAGAIGGPMGMVGNKVALNPITNTSSVTDILMAGKKEELVDVLKEMKTNGELGPNNLSTDYNKVEEMFEPLVQGEDMESLSDMVYNTYLHDINVIDTFMHRGMFGQATLRMRDSDQLKEYVNNNSIRKDFSNLMGSLIELHNKTGISLAVYSEMDQLNEEEVNDRIPEEFKKFEVELDRKHKQIKDLKAKIDIQNKSNTAVTDDQTISKTPKVDSQVETEDQDSLLARLEAEVKLSDKVTKEDVGNMFNIYRKIRAVANGSASEYYLMQNETYDNTILGSKYNRDKKYEHLGDTPLKDQLFQMRFRALEDARQNEFRILKASEIETKVDAIEGTSEAELNELHKIYKDNTGFISKKVVDKMNKLYGDINLDDAADLFDIKNPNSVFEINPANGVATNESMFAVYREIIKHESENGNALMNEYLQDSLIEDSEMIRFFNSIRKDIKNAYIPILDEEGRVESVGKKFLDKLQGSTDAPITSNALNIIPGYVNNFKRAVNDANTKNISFDPNSIGLTRDIRSLFKGATATGELLPIDLVDLGISEINDLVNSTMGNQITKHDYKQTDSILDQIEIKEAIGDLLKDWTLRHRVTMMSSLRKNVIDIIDFEYQPGEISDTEQEVHAYKDYTYTSDFFVDFLYDPIKLDEILDMDERLLTEDDKLITEKYKYTRDLLGGTALDLSTGEVSIYKPDEKALFDFFDSPDSGLRQLANLDDYVAFTKVLKSEYIIVPNSVIGKNDEGSSRLRMEGMLALTASKWVLKKAKELMKVVDKSASHLPYTSFKTAEIEETYSIYRDLLEDPNYRYLKEVVASKIDDFEEIYDDADNIASTDLGALNIAIENALFEIYNGNPEDLPDAIEAIDYEKDDLLADIDEYIKNLFIDKYTSLTKNKAKTSREIRAAAIMLGAITTDFTPFYAKLKRDMENAKSSDTVLLAAQEHTAKYAAAYVFSPLYKANVDSYLSQNPDHAIKATFVIGMGGSGKSTAVINAGMKIGTEILADRGIKNLSIIPVSNNESQVKIIDKSIGDMAGEFAGGLEVDDLENLLKEAMRSDLTDEDGVNVAREKLLTTSAIVIDEATYIDARVSDNKGTPQLKNIDNLLTDFNAKYGNPLNPISLILMGDPSQSGKVSVINGVPLDGSVDLTQVFSLSYLDYSFRARNSYLVDSIATMEKSLSPDTYSLDITIEKGMKYGEANGKYYGANIIKASEEDSSKEFDSILNDATIIANIKNNIDKTIAVNKNLAEDAIPETFNVLIAPESQAQFEQGNTAMQQLMEEEGYSEFFTVLPFSEIGGSEANYVFAEMPKHPFGVVKEQTLNGLEATSKALNTALTRAFDFVHIVVKSEDINIPDGNKAKKMPKNQVILPSSKLDSAAKQKVRENYLEMFEGIEAAEEVVAEKPVDGLSSITLTTDPAVKYNNLISKFTDVTGGAFYPPTVVDIFANMNEAEQALYGSFLTEAQGILTSDLANTDARNTILENLEDIINNLATSLDVSIINQLEEIVAMFNDVSSTEAQDRTDMLKLSTVMIRTASRMTELTLPMLAGNIKGSKITVEELVESVTETLTGKNANVYDNLLLDMFKKSGPDIDTPGELALKERLILDSIKLAEQKRAEESIEEDEETEETREEAEEGEGDSTYVDYDIINNLDKGEKDAITNAFNSVIGLQAYIKNTKLTQRAEFNKGDTDPLFGVYETRIKDFDSSELTTIINNLNKADQGTVDGFKDILAPIFDKYTAESAIKELKRITNKARTAALLREAKNRTRDDDHDDNIETEPNARLNQLLVKLGVEGYMGSKVDSSSETKIRAAIVSLDKELIAKINSSENGGALFGEEWGDILELKELFNKVFYKADNNGNVQNPNKVGVRGFKNIGNTIDGQIKGTIEDFIKRRNNETGGTHMITGTNENLFANAKQALTANFEGGEPYPLVETEEALKLFNFSEGNKFKVDEVGVRFLSVKTKKAPFTIAVLTFTNARGDTIIGPQIVSKKATAEVKKFIKKGGDLARDPRNTNKANKYSVLDISLGEDFKKHLIARSGESGYSKDTGLTVDQLMSKGIKLVPTIFASTKRESGLVSRRAGNTVSGELFTFYSQDSSKNMSNSEITKKIKSGEDLNAGRDIVDDSGTIDSALGIVGVHLIPEFLTLKKIKDENPAVKFGEFPSWFSLALQLKFGAFLQVEGKKTFTAKTQKRTIDIGPNLAAFGDRLVTDANNYIGDNAEMRKNVEDVLTRLKNGTVSKLIEDFSYAFGDEVQNKLSENNQYPSSMFFHRPKGYEVYVININDMLEKGTPGFLKNFQEAAEVANFKVKPSIMMNDSNTLNAGKIHDIFIKKYPNILKTTATDMKTPTLVVTSYGYHTADSILEDIKSNPNYFDKAKSEAEKSTDKYSVPVMETFTNYANGEYSPQRLYLLVTEELPNELKEITEAIEAVIAEKDTDRQPFVDYMNNYKKAIVNRLALVRQNAAESIPRIDEEASTLESQNAYYNMVNNLYINYGPIDIEQTEAYVLELAPYIEDMGPDHDVQSDEFIEGFIEMMGYSYETAEELANKTVLEDALKNKKKCYL